MKAIRDRQEMVDYLTRLLPSAQVCWDTKRCAFDTFLDGLEMAGCEESLQLEDDISLTQDFEDKLGGALDRAVYEGVKFGLGMPIVQLFSMRKADLTVGSRWDRNFSMNQATYFPAGCGESIRAFAHGWRARHPEHPGGYDLMIRDWLKKSRLPYWVHCPSLVNHIVGPSFINPHHGQTNRQSFTFTERAE